VKRRLAFVVALAFATAALVAGPASAAEPVVAAYTDTGVVVMAIDGSVLHSFPAYQFVSLDGGLLVGSRHTRSSEAVIGSDAATGERRFKIRDAFAPVALANGRKVGFMPDRFANRDPFFSSVWLRTASGRVKAVVRFAGRHATVNPKDFEGEGIPLDQAWSANGNTLAVTFGNDVDLFIYDVWVVDTRTREATRVTRGHVSRFPSLTPSGDRLAALRETAQCGGPGPGYRAGNLVVMDADGSNRSVLLEGDCDVFYTDPRWLSEDELAAARLTRTAPGEYDGDLVAIDAPTGSVTDLVTTGDVGSFSVSSALDAIAYQLSSAETGFEIVDLDDGTTTSFANGVIPVITGAHRLI